MKCAVAESPLTTAIEVFVAALPNAAMVVDSTGTMQSINSGALALLDQSACKGSQETLFSNQREACAQLRRIAKSGQPEIVVLSCDGGKELVFHGAALTDLGDAVGELILLVGPTRASSDRNARAFGEWMSLEHSQRDEKSHSALREEAARFKRLSETDPLTGALNVRAFAAHVTRALADRPGRSGALLFLDLNGFKEINDALGHAAGDRVLMHVAKKLTFPPHTWITTARIGGDEFALWLPGVKEAGLSDVIVGVRARLALPVRVSNVNGEKSDITVTAAIGAACCPDEAQSYDMLKHLADGRMYRDKARYRAKAQVV